MTTALKELDPMVQQSSVKVYVGEFVPETFTKPEEPKGPIGLTIRSVEASKTPSATFTVTLLQVGTEQEDESSAASKRARFMELAETWRKTRGASSRVKDLVKNDAYEAIIAMSWDAVPFIIEELDRTPDHWFLALQKITKTDPVKDESRGVLRMMANDWIAWALEHGHYRR